MPKNGDVWYADGMKMLTAIALAFAVAALPGCSTRPRGDGGTFELRGSAALQIENGERLAARGEEAAAMALLDDALRLAVLADDAALRVRADLARGAVLLSIGSAEAAASSVARALEEALRVGDRELTALARIHGSRIRLLSPGGREAAAAIAADAAREAGLLHDRLDAAFAWTVAALAEGEAGRFDRAEERARRSLAAHEGARRLEAAAYDWFMIASFRSRAGDAAGARLALAESMALDRRAENSWGLATGWRALGDVEARAGNPAAARAAFLRAAEIFRALGNETAADDALLRIEGAQ